MTSTPHPSHLCAILIAALCPLLAFAQDASWNVHPALQDRWSIQIGAFIPEIDTAARLNGAGGQVGTRVDFEDDLGSSDRETQGRVLARLRLGERWRVEAEYFTLGRSNTRAIDRTINWGNVTFPVSTVVSSTFESDIYRLSGGYSFVKDDTRELGVAFGLHVTQFETSLAASGVGSQVRDPLVPLPTIGLYGAYALSPRWLLAGRLDFFSLDYDDYDGQLANFSASLEYRFSRHFGVGAGYQVVDYKVDLTKSDYNGGIDYRLSGPAVFLVSSF